MEKFPGAHGILASGRRIVEFVEEAEGFGGCSFWPTARGIVSGTAAEHEHSRQ